MQAGHLVIKADTSQEGVLLLSKSDSMPDIDSSSANDIVWIGEFNDIDAAQMHAHSYYCRHLIDIDAGSYKISKGQAIAAIEGDKLLQETVYATPNLSQQDLDDKAKWTLYYKRRKQRFDWVILALKVVSVGFLLIILVLGF